MFWPMLKNVAGTPYPARIDKMLAVLVPGPSSKVRATVLPLPGAALRAPYGANAYVRLAERADGPISRPASFSWPWGDARYSPAPPAGCFLMFSLNLGHQRMLRPCVLLVRAVRPWATVRIGPGRGADGYTSAAVLVISAP